MVHAQLRGRNGTADHLLRYDGVLHVRHAGHDGLRYDDSAVSDAAR